LSQVLHRGSQAVARGTVHCTSQVLGRGAESVARSVTRLAPHVLDVTRPRCPGRCLDRCLRRRNAAELEEEHSADEQRTWQRSGVNISFV
jgi:hypothetical protein